jgi:hypothetical protein
VAWPFLLDLLRHIGFPQRWTDLLSIMLSSASKHQAPDQWAAGAPYFARSWTTSGRSYVSNALRHSYGGAQLYDRRS